MPRLPEVLPRSAGRGRPRRTAHTPPASPASARGQGRGSLQHTKPRPALSSPLMCGPLRHRPPWGLRCRRRSPIPVPVQSSDWLLDPLQANLGDYGEAVALQVAGLHLRTSVGDPALTIWERGGMGKSPIRPFDPFDEGHAGRDAIMEHSWLRRQTSGNSVAAPLRCCPPVSREDQGSSRLALPMYI
jgi:hypothetical protein